MRKLVFLVLVGMMVVNEVRGQAPAIEWAKCYGGSADDYANSIQETKEGGYIVAGYSGSVDSDVTDHHGAIVSNDYWVVKLNNTGAIQWQKSYGGTGYDEAYSIQQTSDGGYIIVGNSKSNDGDVTGHQGGLDKSDCWIVKINDSGALQWQKSFGGTAWEEAHSVIQTKNGGYIVAGYTESNNGDIVGNHGSADYWIVKLNTTGTIQWQKCLGGPSNDYATSIQQTNDNGYIIAGFSSSNSGDVTINHGYEDYWVVKLDSNGVLKWQKSFGGMYQDKAYSIRETIDGGYIVAGSSTSNDWDVTGHHGAVNNFADYWVVKLDSIGVLQWQKSFGGIFEDIAYSIKQTIDGGYIIAGASNSNDGDILGHNGNTGFDYDDYWLIKLDSIGSLQWQKSLGGNKKDLASSIFETLDGGFCVTGSSKSINGDVSGLHGVIYDTYDFWVVKLAGTTSVEELPTSSISIFPNPTTGSITIKGIAQPSVAVYNLMGQKVVASQGSNEVSLAQLPTGMYLMQVYSKDGELVKSEKVLMAQ